MFMKEYSAWLEIIKILKRTNQTKRERENSMERIPSSVEIEMQLNMKWLNLIKA